MKLYRFFFNVLGLIRSLIRIQHLMLKYPGLKITGKSVIGRNCDIRCMLGSQIRINNTSIGSGTQILADNHSTVEIDDAFIGPNSVIVAKKKIKIYKNCQIAEMVVIRDQNHKFGATGKNIEEQGFEIEEIVIEENVWIAAKSTVLKGVRIGANSVIAAHAVVNYSCESNSMYGGIPAVKIKNIQN